jgi:hypothetical protein
MLTLLRLPCLPVSGFATGLRFAFGQTLFYGREVEARPFVIWSRYCDKRISSCVSILGLKKQRQELHSKPNRRLTLRSVRHAATPFRASGTVLCYLLCNISPLFVIRNLPNEYNHYAPTPLLVQTTYARHEATRFRAVVL